MENKANSNERGGKREKGRTREIEGGREVIDVG